LRPIDEEEPHEHSSRLGGDAEPRGSVDDRDGDVVLGSGRQPRRPLERDRSCE
jgi:hypothetical protein